MRQFDAYTIRARYTSPENACKPDYIAQLAPIAIAHDIASLVGEIDALRAECLMWKAEAAHYKAMVTGGGDNGTV